MTSGQYHTFCMIGRVGEDEDDRSAADPRVQRTRRHVLDVARALIGEVGPMALTYTLLSERSDVTRQTLYRHWPTTTMLFADLVLTGPDVGYPSHHTDPHTVIVEFLTSLRNGMNDPTTAASLTALVAHADHDATSSDALIAITIDRCEALNTLLTNTDVTVNRDDFAQLVSPVFFQRFIARQPVTDQLIHDTTTNWIAANTTSRRPSDERAVR